MKEKLLKLRGQRATLQKEMTGLMAVAERSAEQSTRLTAVMDEMSNIDTEIVTVERAIDLTAKGNAPTRETVIEDGQTRITDVKPAWEKDPKRGYASHRDFLHEVIEVSTGAKRITPQLKSLQVTRAAGGDEQSGVSDPYGAFLLPVAFMPNLKSLTPEGDPIGGRTQPVPMETTKVDIPARVDKNHATSVSGGLRVYRRVETQDVDASRMEMELIRLDADSLMGLSYVSEELLARSPISFAALLETGFRDEFTSKLVDERINGTGVGMCLGILNSPCLVTVAKENAQTQDTITYENIKKMRARCWHYSDAVWLVNNDCLPQLMGMTITIGTGGQLAWQPSARDGEPERLLGRPIIATEYCKTVGDLGDILLCNWSQYLDGQTVGGPQMAESIHVRFVNHERAFKFWMEVGGAPWWRSALTPKHSTSTLSPFVALAAR